MGVIDIPVSLVARRPEKGLEVRYMLFSEMLSDERKEGLEEGLKAGFQEGRDSLLRLMDLMEAGGDTDKIPLLRKDAGLLQKMYDKYHIGV